MSKEAAMVMATGISNPVVNPSLISGAPKDIPAGSPGLQAAETAAKEAPKDELESTRFAIMAKREAKLQAERDAFAKEKAEIAVEKAETQRIMAREKEFAELKGKDPIQAMKMLGFSETDIYNFMAAQEKTEPTAEDIARKAATEEVTKLREEMANTAKEAQAKQNESLIKRFRTEVTSVLKAEPDKFEYCAHNGAVAEELIYDTVVQVLKDTNELITAQEAAQLVEEFYEEEDKAMMSLKKRQPKVEAAPDVPVQQTRTRTVVEKPQVPQKTLTPKMTATAASTIPKNETRDQKKERLINALKNGSL